MVYQLLIISYVTTLCARGEYNGMAMRSRGGVFTQHKYQKRSCLSVHARDTAYFKKKCNDSTDNHEYARPTLNVC